MCKCEVWSAGCEECSAKSEKSGWSLGVALHRGRAQVLFLDSSAAAWKQNTHARARWRTAHASSIDEKGLIVYPKATSAPPRAGTTGVYIYIYDCIYVCVCVCTCVYIYTVCMYIYIYSMYIYIYIYMVSWIEGIPKSPWLFRY